MREPLPDRGDTRIAAGQPQDLYALKRALKPLDWRDYTDAEKATQKATLRQAFPAGVCDYRRPGPLERPPLGTWLDYSFGTDPLRG